MIGSIGGRRDPDFWGPSFWTLLSLFAGNGLQAGAYTLLVADLAQALGLSPGPLGLALGSLSAGAIAGVLAFGWLADHWGRRPVLIVGCVGTGVFFVALGQVNTFSMLVIVMAIGGALVSGFDLSPTTLGGDYERTHGTSSMNRFFAAQDIGGALGAGVCGLALALGANYSTVYAAVGTLLFLLGLAAFMLPLPTAAVAARDAEPPQETRGGDAKTQPLSQSGTALRNRGVVSALAFVALISLVDAAMEGYSSLYLRDELGAGPALAGLAIAVSLLASSAGRLTGHMLLARTGERQVMVVAACTTALAIVVLVGSSLPVVAGVGLLLLRLGQGPIVPIGYSLAARSTPQRAGQATSLAWMSLYGAFLAGPILVGAIAEIGDLRLALGCFIAAAIAIGALATTVAKPVLRHRPPN